MRGTIGRARTTAAIAAFALALPLVMSSPANARPEPPKDPGTIVVDTATPRKMSAERIDEFGPGTKSMKSLAIKCPDNTFGFNRTESCSNIGARIQFLLNGRPRGTAQLKIDATAELNPRDRRKWTQTVKITLTRPTIIEAWAVSATVSLKCGSCTSTSGGTRLLFPHTTQTFTMEASSPGRTLVTDDIYLEAMLTAPRHDTGVLRLSPSLQVRCDSTPRITDKRYGGCVYPKFTPTWQVSVTNPRVAAVAWHIDWAQRNLRKPWGVRGRDHPLHRTTNQTLQAANRRVACGPDVPRPPNSQGQSCDEYPFAATYEGASKNSDYSCHFLDADNNSKEGSFRKAYLNGQRVLDGDAFWVEVVKRAGNTAPPSAMGPVGCGQDPVAIAPPPRD